MRTVKETTRRLFPIVTALVVSLGLAACAAESQPDADGAGESTLAQQTAERGEERDGGEHQEADGDEHSEEGAESGVYIARTASWSETRNDAWLQLSFNSASNSFVGRVSNTGNEPLCDFRVEVHLSTGIELGPTERTGVPYGGSINVTLPSGGEEFTTWTAHPEMSPCEGQ